MYVVLKSLWLLIKPEKDKRKLAYLLRCLLIKKKIRGRKHGNVAMGKEESYML